MGSDRMSEILDSTIKYYRKVSDMSIEALKNEKKFQFRRYLYNNSMNKVVESHYSRFSKSEDGLKLINEYLNAMNGMYKEAQKEYNLVLSKLKVTDDINIKQSILDRYSENGITGFVAKNGARWNIETYSNMYTRHINNQLIRLNVMENAINDLFQVSDHKTKCDLCKPYEGKKLTRKELDNSTLFHPNCKHYITEVVM